jgi:glucosylceramidase
MMLLFIFLMFVGLIFLFALIEFFFLAPFDFPVVLSAAAINVFHMSPKRQREILSAYFGQPNSSLGYTLTRTHINSCDFSLGPYSADDTPNDFNLMHFNISHDLEFNLRLIKEAQTINTAAGADPFKVFGSPWSPPAWMKGNQDMLSSSEPCLLKDPRVHKAWAQYLSYWVTAYLQAGVNIWGLTVQNEPLNMAKWESCVYGVEDEQVSS